MDLSILPNEIKIYIRRMVYDMNRQDPVLLNDIISYFTDKKIQIEFSFKRYVIKMMQPEIFHINTIINNIIKEFEITVILKRFYKKINIPTFNSLKETKKLNILCGFNVTPRKRNHN
jgi:hypothetical protein